MSKCCLPPPCTMATNLPSLATPGPIGLSGAEARSASHSPGLQSQLPWPTRTPTLPAARLVSCFPTAPSQTSSTPRPSTSCPLGPVSSFPGCYMAGFQLSPSTTLDPSLVFQPTLEGSGFENGLWSPTDLLSSNPASVTL